MNINNVIIQFVVRGDALLLKKLAAAKGVSVHAYCRDVVVEHLAEIKARASVVPR